MRGTRRGRGVGVDDPLLTLPPLWPGVLPIHARGAKTKVTKG